MNKLLIITLLSCSSSALYSNSEASFLHRLSSAGIFKTIGAAAPTKNYSVSTTIKPTYPTNELEATATVRNGLRHASTSAGNACISILEFSGDVLFKDLNQRAEINALEQQSQHFRELLNREQQLLTNLQTQIEPQVIEPLRIEQGNTRLKQRKLPSHFCRGRFSSRT
jgi:hypothetical protein